MLLPKIILSTRNAYRQLADDSDAYLLFEMFHRLPSTQRMERRGLHKFLHSISGRRARIAGVTSRWLC